MIATPPQPVVALQERAAVMIRVNQVGYSLDSSKRALAMVRSSVASRVRVHGRRAPRFAHTPTFELLSRGRVTLRARATPTGRWNRGYVVYALDFSRERRAGVYTLRFDGSTVRVRVASPSALYRPIADAALAFLQSQRDGPETISGPMRRRPAHLSETSAQVYSAPRFHGTDLVAAPALNGESADAVGGWFDAGDYLKFTETASFVDAALLYTARDYASGLSHPAALLAEARHGTNWLLQMWDQARGVLYLQVGIGDGTRSERILGDHDVWRLPQHDERIHPRSGSPLWFVAHPPVFAANAPGQPISPNLAGRMAGAFGLCAQVFAASDPAYAQRCLLAGQIIYDRANTHPGGQLVTSFPYAYYTETEWRDDMELGAVELYLGTQALERDKPAGLPHSEAVYYLSPSGYWANAYILARGSGQDSLNLYDVSSLADRDLGRILQTPQAQFAIENIGSVEVPTDAPSLLKDRHDQLALAARLAAREPFGLANPAMPTDTVSHALGYAIQVRLYEAMGGSRAFDALGSNQLAWVLGSNAWGSSFVVGAGSVFPHCLASQIPNLSGSLNGRGRILRGATVNGPAGLSELRELGAPSGYRPCPARGSSDPFRAMTGHGLGYLDDVRSPVTSEPTDDLAALTLLAAAQMASG